MKFVRVGRVQLNCECIVSITSEVVEGPPLRYRLKVLDSLGNEHIDHFRKEDELIQEQEQLMKFLET